ncbi:MAG: helix-turn-helix transcriptional regulator [Oscillospiraceae bacterium]|nr:helix-turn-helix transcriptional regulator [Oscillospiraceae bacterium]MBQ6877611.1 helix-turn-helix transcriptional regulator [Oscillospiraceae bacterium]
MSSLSENIKRYRTQNNITQEQLAEKINVTRQAVSNWENGKTEPDIETLTKIAQIFDISIDELVDGIPTGIKELRGKKTHLYLGIGFTLFYVISSLLMIIFEKPLHDYMSSSYDVFYSAFAVLVWKPITVVSAGIGISAFISYIGKLYVENKYLRTAFLVLGILICLCTTGFMILQFFGIQVFQVLSVTHRFFINYYVFLCKHTILHIFGAVLLFYGLARK